MECVIIKTGALGDIVRTSFIANSLNLKYKYNISWIVSKCGIDLLKFNPNINKVIDVGSDMLPLSADLVISLDDDFEYAKIASEINSKKIIGAFVKDGKILYTDDASYWFDMGLISKYGKEKADILKKENRLSHCQIFEKIFDIQNTVPIFYSDKKKDEYWARIKNEEEMIIGFNLFSGDRWPSKELSISTYIDLIRKINEFLNNLEYNFRLVVFTDRSSVYKVDKIKSELNFITIFNTSVSILDFSAAIKICDYIISTDSLGLHLAIAQQIPNLSFYSPTSACEIETFGSGVKVISTSEDYCSYKSHTDNRSLTANKIFSAWKKHFEKVNFL
jgi:heptosyltransferase-2